MRPTSKTALFCSGIFFGGAVDHAILALKQVERRPYGSEAALPATGRWQRSTRCSRQRSTRCTIGRRGQRNRTYPVALVRRCLSRRQHADTKRTRQKRHARRLATQVFPLKRSNLQEKPC